MELNQLDIPDQEQTKINNLRYDRDNLLRMEGYFRALDNTDPNSIGKFSMFYCTISNLLLNIDEQFKSKQEV